MKMNGAEIALVASVGAIQNLLISKGIVTREELEQVTNDKLERLMRTADSEEGE